MEIENGISQVLQNTNPGQATSRTGATDGPSFGDLLKNSVEDAIDSQYNSERVSAAAIAGEADLIDVLQAVTDAESTLNTVLSIRDRLVQAYQEIARTPI